MSMFDRTIRLRYIQVEEAHPSSAKTQFVSFTDEAAWKVLEGDVEEWIAVKFTNDPNEFIKNDTQLLVVEVLNTPE